jgi:pyridoxal phosphate enzyme (YggS family)
VYKETISRLLEEIATASEGRKVELMAVSKTHPITTILEAVKAGQLLFGENRVQEIEEKFTTDRFGYRLHMIGHLQSNKVKKVVPLVDSIDSVDSLKLAKRISNAALAIHKVMPILIEINTTEEVAKAGFNSLDDYYRLLDEVSNLKGIRVDGLMTMGPLGGDEKTTRQAFARLRNIAQESRVRYPELTFETLSMGMSGDYLWAIKEGSTQVRLGSAIFGMRGER